MPIKVLKVHLHPAGYRRSTVSFADPYASLPHPALCPVNLMGTRLHTEPCVSPGSVSGEAYSWVCCGVQSLGASQHTPPKGHARGCPWTIHFVGRGGYPGEWVSQSSRKAILLPPGAPKRDVCTPAELFSWRWLQLHSTSMEILLSAIENSDLKLPDCRALERVAREGQHQDWTLAWGGGPLAATV